MNFNHLIRGSLIALAAVPALSPAQTTAVVPGRLLASNCFQCHGTNGTGGLERLAGESASEIISELKEMRTKTPPDMMDVHARGYTDAQIKLIADYFAAQRRR
jgi:sulfide dehydrogenase cytochrome subunit